MPIPASKKALQIKPEHHVAHSNILCSRQHDPGLDASILKRERMNWWQALGRNLPIEPPPRPLGRNSIGVIKSGTR